MAHYEALNSDLKNSPNWVSQRKTSVLVFAFIFAFIFLLSVQTSGNFNPFDFISKSSLETKLVENILEASYKPKNNGKSIFFIETKKHEDKVLTLSPRQACSIESAAMNNPDYDVFVLFSNEVKFLNATPTKLIDALLSYHNVHLNYFNIFKYAENSPLEKWMQEGKLFNSSHVVTHTSDVLRMLTLWKYTGTYLDTDVIIKKRIESIGTNFACIQNDGLINSAIVSLDGSLGRSITEKSFQELIAHFNGAAWTANGPDILSKIVRDMCNKTNPQDMNRQNCQGFKVLPTNLCFAVDYPAWATFFQDNKRDEVIEKTKDSHFIHFWNYMSASAKLSKNSNSAYITLAKQFCPRVLAASDEDF